MAGEKTIGKGSLYLGTNAQALEKGLSGARSMVSGWAVGLTDSFAIVGNSFAGLAAALSFKGITLSLGEIGSQVAEQFDEIDKAAKAASRVGTDIDSLLGFEHAANLSGAKAEQVRDAIVRLNRATALAANGNRAYSETFNQLGINQAEFQAMDPTERMRAVADGLAGIGSQAQRTAIAQQLFGKSGANLLPFLQAGGQAILEQQQDYERLAGTIGAQGASAVEEANDAATRAETAWVGIIRQLTIGLAPVKELVSIIATELIVGMREMMPETTNWGDVAVDVFENVGQMIVRLGEQIRGFGASAIGAIIPVAEAMQSVSGAGEALVTGGNYEGSYGSFLEGIFDPEAAAVRARYSTPRSRRSRVTTAPW